MYHKMGWILKMTVAAEICVDLWASSSAKAQSPATFGRPWWVFLGTVLLLLRCPVATGGRDGGGQWRWALNASSFHSIPQSLSPRSMVWWCTAAMKSCSALDLVLFLALCVADLIWSCWATSMDYRWLSHHCYIDQHVSEKSCNYIQLLSTIDISMETLTDLNKNNFDQET